MVFGADGNGLGYDRTVISIHKNYSEYSTFMRELRSDVGESMELNSFLVSLASQGIVHHLSPRLFAEQLIKNQNEGC